MKKKLICLILSVLCLIAFCGCKEIDENGNEVTAHFSVGTFIVVEESHPYMIIVHKETKVMYLYHKGTYGGGITIMLDENGEPLLWEEG